MLKIFGPMDKLLRPLPCLKDPDGKDSRLKKGIIADAFKEHGAEVVYEMRMDHFSKKKVSQNLENFTLYGQQRDWALLCEFRILFAYGLFDHSDQTGATERSQIRWTIQEKGLLYSFFHDNYTNIKETVFGKLWTYLDEGQNKGETRPSVANYKHVFPTKTIASKIKSSDSVPDFVKDFVLAHDWRTSDEPDLLAENKERFRFILKSLFEFRRFLPVLVSGHALNAEDGWRPSISSIMDEKLSRLYIVQRVKNMGYDPDEVFNGFRAYESNMKDRVATM
jgi:hypothetical protein